MFRHKVWSAILILTIAVLINLAGSVLSQDDGDGDNPMNGQPSPDEMQEMMDKWMQTMQPGPAHEHLKYFEGKWTTKMRMFWGDEPMETTGTVECELILGGRFVVDHHRATMMMPDENGEMKPTPFEGLGITGHDNFRGMYSQVWMDSMSTGQFISKGSRLPDGSFDFYGEMDEPMLGVVGRMVRSNIRIVDPNSYVFTMYDLHAGPDYKVMEITYKRVTGDD